ncbi:hypothetical protein BS17DRAFT_797791 [Gyrodon lividus]|nr:hypothetical protein BS17DRAFT_797791 [Gyrodon lividus]
MSNQNPSEYDRFIKALTSLLLQPKSSSHCPHVLASNCLLLWTTSMGLDWQKELDAKLPDSSIFKLFQVMICSLDQNTRSNYGTGLLHFTHLTHLQASNKMLNNWLAGLHFWHTVNSAIWNGADMLRAVRRGFAKLALCILFDLLDSQSPFNIATGAVAFTAFWSCCHLGELIICNGNDFDPLKHISCSILPLNVQTLSNNTSYLSFHIPWTKTTKEQGADISVMAHPHHMSPLEALSHHECINADIPHSAPLFSYRTSTGWQPLVRAEFINCCNDIWVQNSFPSMPGHTFHIGSTMELLLQGVNPDIILVQGRWTSRAFLDYWCHIESILPLFISSSMNLNYLQDVDATIRDFSKHNVPQF